MTTSPTSPRRPAGRRRSRRGAFTMIELLVVLAIIGIMAVMIIPTVSGSDVARVRTAARGLMQMSRYARTMAILRQETLLLEISTDGTLHIVPGGDGGSGGGAGGGSGGAPAAPPPGPEPDSAPGTPAPPTAEDGQPSGGGGGEGSRMSETETTRVFKQIRFVAELDEDRLDESEAGTEFDAEERDEETDEKGKTRAASRTVRVPYEGNGRCLPYRVRILPEGFEEGGEDRAADSAVVIVDRFGNAKVEDEDER